MDARQELPEVIKPVERDFWAAVVTFIGLLFFARWFWYSGSRSDKDPDGPPTVFFWGNELVLPDKLAHLKLTGWSGQHGDFFSIKRFSSTTFVISSRELVKDFIDRKSNIFSERPNTYINRLMTGGDHMLMMGNTDQWKNFRRVISQFFRESKCERDHYKVQEAEASQMLFDYLKKPDDHMMHPKRFSNSITNSLVFGIRSKTVHDPYVEKLYHLMGKWADIQAFGGSPPLDEYPWLRWVPDIISGRWRARAKELRRLMRNLYSEVLEQVRERRERGVFRESFMDGVLDNLEKDPFTENELRFLGGVLMEGGSDTSSSLLLTIVQAMSHHPEVQQRAHEEIDALMGAERSPRWSDFSKLPYINMIVKEAHRWRPVIPAGVPHATSQKTEINGFKIPKGSPIIINTWGIHHARPWWGNPDVFDPERFKLYPELSGKYVGGEWEDRDHYGYGAGRRVCPGIHLADRGLFIAVAKLLWAFEFSIPEGKELQSSIWPTSGTTEGFVLCPKPYPLNVGLRHPRKQRTIEREYLEAHEVFNRYD